MLRFLVKLIGLNKATFSVYQWIIGILGASSLISVEF